MSVGATERPQGGPLSGASEGGFVRLRACRRLGGPQGQRATPSEGLCRRCLAPQAPPLKPPSEDHPLVSYLGRLKVAISLQYSYEGG